MLTWMDVFNNEHIFTLNNILFRVHVFIHKNKFDFMNEKLWSEFFVSVRYLVLYCFHLSYKKKITNITHLVLISSKKIITAESLHIEIQVKRILKPRYTRNTLANNWFCVFQWKSYHFFFTWSGIARILIGMR